MFNITSYVQCFVDCMQSVTLYRNGSGQKVGLTLCYGSPYDGFTDVFVGEVSESSLLCPVSHDYLKTNEESATVLKSCIWFVSVWHCCQVEIMFILHLCSFVAFILTTFIHHLTRWLNLLSTHETLDNWTDGRISCRHSASSLLVSFMLLKHVWM